MFIYVIIFVAKIVEVALMTIRTVLITRGEKVYGSIIGFFEISIWLYLINKVLVGISEDPIRMVTYALGYACGNYVGCIMEEKLALGLLTISVIIPEIEGNELTEILRKENVGVTKVKAEGINKDKSLLLLHIKRKRKNEVIKLIEENGKNCVISISDTKTVMGGYGIKK